ncbi:MAG: M1 family metallopeptidase [Phycisphaerae bacterium]|nr:M1 family metallopeptidase [Phycisphaerae bacterium]
MRNLSRTSTVLLAASFVWVLCGSVRGQTGDQPDEVDPRIDPQGRQVALWPPARHFDHLHMTLELDIPDIRQAGLIATMTLFASAVGSERRELVLDCNGPRIQSVRADGIACGFTITNGHLIIALPAPVAPGRSVEVVIRYMLDYSANKGEGLTYSPGKPDAESETGRHPQIHAQGQAQLNSKWFPCHDSPNEKLTTELIVTVEEGFNVVSNGRLISSRSAAADPDGMPQRRWHWRLNRPHSPYLVTLVVGKLALVEVGGPSSTRPNLAMPVYAPLGTESVVRDNFAATPDMMAFFERTFDEPFPWDQYAQCIVRDFAAGGMENTGCTLLTIDASRGDPGSQEDLIAHELAHQWFGNLVTCRSWAHLWLNEGWATYSESLWKEHRGGQESQEKARTAYQKSIRGLVRGQLARNRTVAPLGAPLVTNRYLNPDAMFSRAEDPYAKGALVLHMLRARLGAEAFLRGTRAFLDTYKFGTVDTDDFRREMERAGGQSLELFFNQWTGRPGLPRLDAEINWDDSAKALSISLTQTQTINAMNPAFAITLPVHVRFTDGSSRWLSIDMDARAARGVFPLAEKPAGISLDPHMTIIAAVNMKKDLAWWLDEVEFGPTFAARMQAAEYLSAHEHNAARETLLRVAADQQADSTLRNAALKGATLSVAGR